MGTFIAPKSGLYMFTWTIRLYGQTYHTTELVVNNNIVNALYFNPNGQMDGSVSRTAVVNVNQGDDVLIRTSSDYHNGDIKSFPNGRSSFAGWILMQKDMVYVTNVSFYDSFLSNKKGKQAINICYF